MNNENISRPPKRLGTVGAHRTNQKSRCWLLTFNFPPNTKPDALTEQDKLNIRAFNRAAQVHPVTYCVYQGEVGEKGTYHLQAYVEFAVPRTMPQIKAHFGLSSLHCEIRIGTQQQAIDYCTKEETRASEIHEYGVKGVFREKPGQGSRNDLATVWDDLKKGKQIADIIDAQPGTIRYVSMMQKAQYEALISRKRTFKTRLHVFYGCAGTGKTSTAIEFAKTLGSYFLLPNDGKAMWWNGYDPLKHQTIILDEFTGSKCPLTFLNQLADKFDLRVQTKGGFLPFIAPHLIITSNFHPRMWYEFDNKNKNLCWEALERRIDTLVQFRLDIHINEDQPNGGNLRLDDKRLHVEIEKGALDLRYISSEFPLDRTVPNSPEIPASPLPDSPVIPSAPIPKRWISKGKRELLDLECSESVDSSDSDDSDPVNIKRRRAKQLLAMVKRQRTEFVIDDLGSEEKPYDSDDYNQGGVSQLYEDSD